MRRIVTWLPAAVLSLGAILTVGLDSQRSEGLKKPLESVIPMEIEGFQAREVQMSDAERRVVGVDQYLARDYRTDVEHDSTWFSLYIGYYERQMRGRTIHTPKNCLPGAGWDALASERIQLDTDVGPVSVNRYLLQNGSQQALVLYWYQGRGRIQANEFIVKWDLLRDAALKRRTEEALVRIVTPVTDSEDAAFNVAARVARVVIPRLFTALPK